MSAAPGRPFAKGQSGNPRGRPKKSQEEQDLRGYIRRETANGKSIVDTLMGLLRTKRTPAAVKIHAARLLAEYGFSRPKQTVEVREAGPSPRMLEVRAMLKILSKPEIEAQLAFAKTVAERARLAETAGT